MRITQLNYDKIRAYFLVSNDKMTSKQKHFVTSFNYLGERVERLMRECGACNTAI